MKSGRSRQFPSFLLTLLTAVIMFSSIVVLLLPRAAIVRVPPYRNFASSKDGLSFTYPSSWQVRQSPSEISVAQPGSPYGFTVIVLQNIGDTNKYIDNLGKSSFFDVDPDSSIRIGNLRTLALIDRQSGSHTQYMLYAPSGSRVWEVVFLTDSPQRTAAIKDLLATFTFTAVD